MTQDQVKSELNELRMLIGSPQNNLLNERWSELRNKYDIAIKQLDVFDQLIFRERILLRRTYIQAGMKLHYSEECIRKRWRKITKKLAEILTKPKTNFDRITENEEALAAFIVNNTSNCYHCFLGIDGKCEFALKYLGDEACLQSIKEWLQKECEE